MTWKWVPHACLPGAGEAGSLEILTSQTKESLYQHLSSPVEGMKVGGLAGPEEPLREQLFYH